MSTNTAAKPCLSCGKNLMGRADKKFCNDYCRNAYNNSQKSANNLIVRNVNNALLKNRKILESVLGEEGMAKTTKAKLLDKGFQFKFLTHTYKNQKGQMYCFCYEYGYLPLENDWFLVVKRKEI
jgi:hypothetical protein